MEQNTLSNHDEINIEEIMQEIRQQILAKKDAIKPQNSAPLFVRGKRLPPDFYEYLYQAGLVHNQISVKLHVTKSMTPLIGPLLDRARHVVHQLVLFYVNKLAAEQIQFNTQILYAVSLLAQELEKDNTSLETTDSPIP